jgi:hypothetical protein
MSRELHEKTDKLFTKLFFTVSDTLNGRGLLVPKRDTDSAQLRKAFYEKLINNDTFKQLVLKDARLIPSREAIDRLRRFFFDDKTKDANETEYGNYGNSNLATGIIRTILVYWYMPDMGATELEEELWRIIYEILVSLSKKSDPYDDFGDKKPITEKRGPRLGKGLRGLDMHPRKQWLAKFGEGGEYVPGSDPWENIDVALATAPPSYSQFGRITPQPYAAIDAVAPGDAEDDDLMTNYVAPPRRAPDSGGRRRKSRKSRKPRKSSNKKRKQRKTKRRRQ